MSARYPCFRNAFAQKVFSGDLFGRNGHSRSSWDGLWSTHYYGRAVGRSTNLGGQIYYRQYIWPPPLKICRPYAGPVFLLLFVPKSGWANGPPGPLATNCSNGTVWLLALKLKNAFSGSGKQLLFDISFKFWLFQPIDLSIYLSTEKDNNIKKQCYESRQPFQSDICALFVWWQRSRDIYFGIWSHWYIAEICTSILTGKH